MTRRNRKRRNVRRPPVPLRVVAPDEHAAPRIGSYKLTVTEAAESGSRRELLVAMRDRIAVAVENPDTPQRDLAALTRRLMEVAKDIEVIDARAERDDDGGAGVADAEFDATAV